MEIKLIFTEEDMLAALLSVWRSVRRLPSDLHMPIAQKLIADDYPAYRPKVTAEIMAALFSTLAGHLDPEVLRQWDTADIQTIRANGGYLYEPVVRQILAEMGHQDLADTRVE